ncbi:hypothetical protein HanRHA438_Chr12g0552301 [Helianthus annuus]|nr:hypothetical protein HanIR_Chr12g0583271 [Helianthus annuus]KAJ0866485.1 hypothetical protein HanRHA438_Chr12g0552301 [Helianthus annuus]
MNTDEHKRRKTNTNKRSRITNINEHKPPLSCTENDKEHIGDWNESGEVVALPLLGMRVGTPFFN